MGATGSTANVSLLRKRGIDVLKPTYVPFAVDLALLWVVAPTGMVVWYGKVWVCCCVSNRGTGGREARRPRPSVCVMATGSRSYGPLHLVVIVIEMRALQPTVQHTRHCDGLDCKQRTLLLCDYSG